MKYLIDKTYIFSQYSIVSSRHFFERTLHASSALYRVYVEVVHNADDDHAWCLHGYRLNVPSLIWGTLFVTARNLQYATIRLIVFTLENFTVIRLFRNIGQFPLLKSRQISFMLRCSSFWDSLIQLKCIICVILVGR